MAKLATFLRLDTLVDLAAAGADIRPALLVALTDMYVQRPVHTREEDLLFSELVPRLLEGVDGGTRAAVTAKLGAYPAAPPALIGLLAKTAEPAARRPRPGHAEPAAADCSELSELFASATAQERRLILIHLDLAAASLARGAGAARADAIAALERLALQRRTEEFVTGLARLLDVADAQGRWIVEDGGGEPIVVAAKSIGMPIEILQRVLLFLNPAISHSIPRVYGLVRLFDEITTSAARALVSIWATARPRAARPRVYAPVLWRDAAETARYRLRAPGAPSPRSQAERPMCKGDVG